MLVELGPVAATEVHGWTRFVRRLVTELRTDPHDLEGVVSDDFLDYWSRLIDEWADIAASGETFRHTQSLDCELAEFLLHGFERCYHSPGLATRITADEAERHRPFTMHVVRCFIDGLAVEGRPHEQYAERIRASLGNSLD